MNIYNHKKNVRLFLSIAPNQWLWGIDRTYRTTIIQTCKQSSAPPYWRHGVSMSPATRLYIQQILLPPTAEKNWNFASLAPWEGKSQVTSGLPSHRASNAEKIDAMTPSWSEGW